MTKEKAVVITVSDDALKTIEKVATDLKAIGMKVEQVLSTTGIITGSCPESKRVKLKKVVGVQSVEDELEVNLPPMDSGVQ